MRAERPNRYPEAHVFPDKGGGTMLGDAVAHALGPGRWISVS